MIPSDAFKHRPDGALEISAADANIPTSDPALWIGRTWCEDHPAPVVNVGTYTVVRPLCCNVQAAIWTHEAEPETITGHACECPCPECARVTRWRVPWIACAPRPLNFAALHHIGSADPVADLYRALGAKPATPQV
ncbi:MAG: hypothetical protein ACYC6C_10735 [Coriobacteriia bacterium]